MGCAEKDCYTAFAKDDDLSFPGTEGQMCIRDSTETE